MNTDQKLFQPHEYWKVFKENSGVFDGKSKDERQQAWDTTCSQYDAAPTQVTSKEVFAMVDLITLGRLEFVQSSLQYVPAYERFRLLRTLPMFLYIQGLSSHKSCILHEEWCKVAHSLLHGKGGMEAFVTCHLHSVLMRASDPEQQKVLLEFLHSLFENK